MKRQCCLSNSDDAEIVYSPGQKNQPQFKETDLSPTASDFGIFYTLARCKECGALFAILEGEGLDLRGLYSSSRDSLYLSQGPSRNRIYKRVFDDIKGFIPRGGRLLDVGCSYGFFLKLARDKGVEAWGVEAWGVEMSEDASRYCKERLGLSVLCADIKGAELPQGYFDAVTAIEVLEHSDDPGGFIDKIRQVLKPGGLFYLVTPDIKSLSAKIMGYRWWSYRKMHLFYFSRKSIYSLLKRKGFSVIKSKPYQRTFTLGYLISQFFRAGHNKLFYYPFYYLTRLLNTQRLEVNGGFGDIAVLARKA